MLGELLSLFLVFRYSSYLDIYEENGTMDIAPSVIIFFMDIASVNFFSGPEGYTPK